MNSPGYFAHESAVIDDGARIGTGTRIWHFTHVMPSADIGPECVIGQGCYIGKATLGRGVKVQNNVSVYDGVILEDGVFCGPSCVFTNVINPRAFIERKHEYQPTLVKQGATIGANATIVCGVTIGEHAFVGAGAVVRRDVPAYALVAGVPARQLGWMCKCAARLQVRGETLDGATIPDMTVPDAGIAPIACSECGREYLLSPTGLRGAGDDDGHTLRDTF